LSVRRRAVVPLLAGIAFDPDETRDDNGLLRASWRHRAGRLRLIANLSGEAVRRPADWKSDSPIWGGEPGPSLPPWSVFWSIGTG
jgi:hypothetical protein